MSGKYHTNLPTFRHNAGFWDHAANIVGEAGKFAKQNIDNIAAQDANLEVPHEFANVTSEALNAKDVCRESRWDTLRRKRFGRRFKDQRS